jgi:hypothetical protein
VLCGVEERPCKSIQGGLALGSGRDSQPNPAVVAPRSARDLGTGRKPTTLVGVPQWVRTDSSRPPWPKPRQQAGSALHVHTQPRASEAGGPAKTGRVLEPRKGDRCGRKESSPGSQEGKADGCHWPAGRSPDGVRASGQDTTGGEERGLSAQGELGHVGEPRVAWSDARRGGPGDHRPWRALGASPRARARQGEHDHHGRWPGIGKRATSAAPRAGPGGSLRGA